jgi:hypothetical protein
VKNFVESAFMQPLTTTLPTFCCRLQLLNGRSALRQPRADADVSEVVAILCSMASAAHVLGESGKRDQTIEGAAVEDAVRWRA